MATNADILTQELLGYLKQLGAVDALETLSEGWPLALEGIQSNSDASALLTLQDSLEEVRRAAIAEVSDSEGIANAAWALDRLSELTGEPWRGNRPEEGSHERFRKLVTELEREAPWAAKVEVLSRRPGWQKRSEVEHFFQHEIGDDYSADTFALFRRLMIALDDVDSSTLRDLWFLNQVYTYVSDYLTWMLKQKLTGGADKKQLKAVRAFVRKANAVIGGTLGPG